MSAAGPALWRFLGRLSAPSLRSKATAEAVVVKRSFQRSRYLTTSREPVGSGSIISQVRRRNASIAATQNVKNAVLQSKKPSPPSTPGHLRKITQTGIRTIFGEDVSAEHGNKILQQLQSQRKAGTLDAGIPEEPEHNLEAGLAWLRQNIPWDEDASIMARFDREEEAERARLIARAEKLGIYKRTEPTEDTIEDPLPEQEEAPVTYVPQQDRSPGNKQNRSFFAELRERNRKLQDEEEQAKRDDIEKARPAAEKVRLPATLGTRRIAQATKRQQELAENMKWKEKKLEEGQSTWGTEAGKWPDLTVTQRLWPSALMTLFVVGLSLAFAHIYVPPPKAGRIWPEWSPAYSTVGVLIAVNVLACMAWRIVALNGFMFRNFMSVPGYPRASALIGNTFSHQGVLHLTVNMVSIWIFGTRLHEDLGRGTFLATYFSTAAISSFFSLSGHVYRSVFATGSLGASGIVCGLVATWCVINKDHAMKIWGIPAEKTEWVPTLGILAVVMMFEIAGMRKGSLAKPFQGTDFLAHLGGYVGGIMAGSAILWSRKKQVERKGEEKQFSRVLGRAAP